MKKKCTSTNNSISLDAHTACIDNVPCSTNTTISSCKNPLKFILEQSLQLAITTSVSFDVAYTQLVTSGLILNNNGVNNVKLCCPVNPCLKNTGLGPTSFPYWIGDMVGFESVVNALFWSPNLLTPTGPPCCINVYGDVTVNADYSLLMGGPSEPDCCINSPTITVSPCFNELTLNYNLSNLLSQGVIEIGGPLSYDDEFTCTLMNFLQTVETNSYFNTTMDDFIESFFELGFSVMCCGCNIFIGNNAALIAWWPDNNIGCTY
jgi:hypothetical protein